MTKITVSGGEELFIGNYANPKIATYITYPCTYCQEEFYLVDPDNFQAGGAIRTVQYRNPNTNEIKAVENRAEGICISCAKEIMRKQQEKG